MLNDLVFNCIIWFVVCSCVSAYVTTNPNETVTIGGLCTCEALYMPKSAFPTWMVDKDQYRLPDNHTNNFLLYSRGQKDLQKRPFSLNENLSGTSYDASKPTFVFFHGYTETSFLAVFQLIKDEYLKKVDGNVIMIDWSKGSSTLNNYPQTITNSEAAGCQAAILIKNLVQQRGSNIKSFYFSGHSLGCQTAAFTAKKLKVFLNNSIYRISALDPSKIWYHQTTSDHNLKVGDADFIDVIHAGDSEAFLSQIYFGDIVPAGDVDFYPDGGRVQTACPAAIVLVNDITELCSHVAAAYYFASSINGPCDYTACSCPSVPLANTTEKDWQKCLQNCNPATTSFMGYHADESPGKGPHYLTISKTDPKCTTVFSSLKFNDILNMFNKIVIDFLKLIKLYNPIVTVVKTLQKIIGNIVNKFTGILPIKLHG